MICLIFFGVLVSAFAEETKQVLRLSLTEFSLPKFYLLFGISKVKSAAVIAFRSSYRDRSFSPGSYERETFALSSLETVTEALLEIMEVSYCCCYFKVFVIFLCISSTVLIFLNSIYFEAFYVCYLNNYCFSPGLYEGHSWMQMVGSVD